MPFQHAQVLVVPRVPVRRHGERLRTRRGGVVGCFRVAPEVMRGGDGGVVVEAYG